jgi:hypothetical protein
MRRKILSKKEIAVRIDIPRIAMNREPRCGCVAPLA